MKIEDLKAGDFVHIKSRHYSEVATVEKVGKIHVIVNGNKYSAKNGFRAGVSRWYVEQITPITPEQADELNRRVQMEKEKTTLALSIHKITENYNALKTISFDDLKAIEAITSKYVKP